MSNKKVFIISQHELASVTGGSCNINFELCDLLIANGYNVTDILYSKNPKRPDKLNNKVNFVNLYDKNKTFSEKVNQYLENNPTDLIIFFFPSWYLQANLSEKYKNIPKILMFHSRPDYYFATNSNLNSLEKIYNNTVSQILFPSYYELLPKYIQNSPVVNIPNFSVNQIISENKKESKKIVYLSRLDNYKQQAFLIKSFSKISNKIPDWTLDIYGDGDEYYKICLKEIIKQHKLTKQVFLKGITQTPIETLKQYDFCVFPSCFEGFPVGLIEAQSVGLPAIGLKKASGVNELIIDNVNGYLTNYDLNDFSNAILDLCQNKEKRKIFSKNTVNLAKNYSKDKWDNAWLDLINNIIKNEKISSINLENNIIKNFSIEELHKISSLKNPFPFYKKFLYIKKTKKMLLIYFMGLKFLHRYT